jgi:shikimate kinase/3-dehydroquinate synthase
VWVGPLQRAPWPAGARRLVISDETVAALHGARVPDAAGLIEIPPGEEHKTLQTAERVWHALVEQGATRADHVVALGGGVVGDLAGFCAATYQRGVGVVQVRPRSWPRSTPPTAARPGSTCPRPRTTSAPTTSRRACSPTPALLQTLAPQELAAATPRSSRRR